MGATTTNDKMRAVVNAHPDHMYSYSPQNTEADTRYVFTHRTYTSLSEAYVYCTSEGNTK